MVTFIISKSLQKINFKSHTLDGWYCRSYLFLSAFWTTTKPYAMVTRMRSIKQMPNLDQENHLWADGYCRVAGIDEAGRGALAGPVVAAAVIVPSESHADPLWQAVCDSKLLKPVERQELSAQIKTTALAYGIGVVESTAIDQTNIALATRRAMCAAVMIIDPAPDYLLIDWVRLPELIIAQQSMVKADMHIVSVAAASILAKVHRDSLMVALDEQHPGYGFAQHKGYGTAAHRRAIEQLGPCPVHRQSFAPVAKYVT